MPKKSDLEYARAMRLLNELEKVLEGDEEAENEGVEEAENEGVEEAENEVDK